MKFPRTVKKIWAFPFSLIILGPQTVQWFWEPKNLFWTVSESYCKPALGCVAASSLLHSVFLFHPQPQVFWRKPSMSLPRSCLRFKEVALPESLSLSLLFSAVRCNAWDGWQCVRADDRVHHGLRNGGGRTRTMEGPCQKGCGASVLFRVPSLYTEDSVGWEDLLWSYCKDCKFLCKPVFSD